MKSGGVQVIPIRFEGWSNSYRIANDQIELVVVGSIGPRILHFGWRNERNILKLYHETAGLTGGLQWRMYGGHRLWRAPETIDLTYLPDNDPCELIIHEHGVQCIQEADKSGGIEKQIEIQMDPVLPKVSIIHRFINRTDRDLTCALWALTALDTNGVVRIPVPPRGEHPRDLLPSHSVVFWPYSDPADPRISFRDNCFCLRHDPCLSSPLKLGFARYPVTMTYEIDHSEFSKTTEPQTGSSYPDMGSTCEVFINAEMVELETLSPTCVMPPEMTFEHIEIWNLKRFNQVNMMG